MTQKETAKQGHFIRRLLLVVVAVVLLAGFVIVSAMHGHEEPPKRGPQEQELWEMTLDLNGIADEKIHRLYEDKKEEIEGRAEELVALWDLMGPVEIAEDDTEYWLCIRPPYLYLSKEAKSGEYELYFCDVRSDDEWPPYQKCEWDCPEELEPFLDVLWSEYEVEYVYLTSEFVSFEIIEDRLTYYLEEDMVGLHEKRLDDHWGHFWFEYGI